MGAPKVDKGLETSLIVQNSSLHPQNSPVSELASVHLGPALQKKLSRLEDDLNYWDISANWLGLLLTLKLKIAFSGDGVRNSNVITYSLFSAVQLIGISVAGLEPEFQPIVNYLLPHIISCKQDDNDMYLQVEDTATAELLLHTLIDETYWIAVLISSDILLVLDVCKRVCKSFSSCLIYGFIAASRYHKPAGSVPSPTRGISLN
ncbi:hypothetical protein MTR67_004366 [Solanum verrucosum]|uniref:Uncharacterized protein n=1 Tax=Solanum verrucosum TaxID=315347 RepID=A0AAF0PUI0_SOLVR|nr:hypothetical protein MTR67_004366 [Solanum verrucosum]